MSRILALDQGTTSTKAYRADDDGFTLVGTRTHRQIRPAPGWVEHDAAELLSHLRELIELADPCDVAGLANQGETVVAWDAATKRPLHHAIVWQDDRTSTALARMKAEGIETLTLDRSGLPLDPYFSASKLRWLLDNAEGAADLRRQGRLRLGTSDAFFLDALTGRFATDVSTASRTGLMDLRRRSWDEDLCAAFGVPLDCLPEIRPTVGEFGTLPGGTRLVASAVDQQASLFGHGCRTPGDLKITFGTGAFALGLTGSAPMDVGSSGLLPTCAWQIGNAEAVYALDGGILTAGAALEWLKAVGLVEGFEALDALDGPSAVERGLVFVPALAGLGAPYWDRSARGGWIGLDLSTSRDDLVRAVLEGIAFRAAEVVAAFERTAGHSAARVSVDGGLSQSRYFGTFLASALGRGIEVSEHPDLTAWGLVEFCRLAGGHASDLAGYPRRRLVEASAPLPPQHYDRFADALSRLRGWAPGD